MVYRKARRPLKMNRGFALMLYWGAGGGKLRRIYSSDRHGVSRHSPLSYLKHPGFRGSVRTLFRTSDSSKGLRLSAAALVRVLARLLSCCAWSLSDCVTQ